MASSWFEPMIGPEKPAEWQSVVYGGGKRSKPIFSKTVRRDLCPICTRNIPCAGCVAFNGIRQPASVAPVAPVLPVARTGYDVFADRLKSIDAAHRRNEKQSKPLSERTKQHIAEAQNMPDKPFCCENEAEVVFLFAEIAREIGYHIRRLQPHDYPDGLFADKDGNLLRVEFEYIDVNFIAHAHNPDEVDTIVCWKRTPRGRELLTVPVIALQDHYNKNGKRWDWSSL